MAAETAADGTATVAAPRSRRSIWAAPALSERRHSRGKRQRLHRHSVAHQAARKRPRLGEQLEEAIDPYNNFAEAEAAAPVDDGSILLGDLAPKSLAWTYPLKDEEWRCFAGYLPAALSKPEADRFFEVVRDGTTWQQPKGRWGLLPLKTAWMAKAPCNCVYGYGGAQVAADPFPEWMDELLGVIMPLCGLPRRETWPNSCNLNLYEDGKASVGWHSDNESLFQGKVREIRIISLSLGQTRKFELKYGNSKSDTYQMDLAHGDLCTMEGLCQKHYKHQLGKDFAKNVKARINITFRWIVEHTSICASTACQEEAVIEDVGGTISV